MLASQTLIRIVCVHLRHLNWILVLVLMQLFVCAFTQEVFGLLLVLGLFGEFAVFEHVQSSYRPNKRTLIEQSIIESTRAVGLEVSRVSAQL